MLSAKKAEKTGHMLETIKNMADVVLRPMYCKDKIYTGTQEFSFEELRAIRHTERKKRKQQEGKGCLISFNSFTFGIEHLFMGSFGLSAIGSKVYLPFFINE